MTPRSGLTAADVIRLLALEPLDPEGFHFYLGDPVRMLLLRPDGKGEVAVLGTDLAAGQRPQVVVPGGTWPGAQLVEGGGSPCRARPKIPLKNSPPRASSLAET